MNFRWQENVTITHSRATCENSMAYMLHKDANHVGVSASRLHASFIFERSQIDFSDNPLEKQMQQLQQPKPFCVKAHPIVSPYFVVARHMYMRTQSKTHTHTHTHTNTDTHTHVLVLVFASVLVTPTA